MKKINDSLKRNLYGGASVNSNLWTATMSTGVLGQTFVGSISLLAQIIHSFNPNPKYYRADVIDNTAARIYARTSGVAWQSTLSFGSPYF